MRAVTKRNLAIGDHFMECLLLFLTEFGHNFWSPISRKLSSIWLPVWKRVSYCISLIYGAESFRDFLGGILTDFRRFERALCADFSLSFEGNSVCAMCWLSGTDFTPFYVVFGLITGFVIGF